MIRVIVADDHLLIREGIKYILEEDKTIKVISFANNGKEVLDLCKTYLPDVVLMDINMPEYNGVEGTKLVKNFNSNIKVIVLTSFKDRESVYNSFKYGADGFVLKEIAPEALHYTIKTVMCGLKVMDDSVCKNLIENYKSFNITSDKKSLDFELNEKELSIISLIIKGMSNKEIAAAMKLSEGTIKNLISKILEKTNMQDRTSLAVFALKNALVN